MIINISFFFFFSSRRRHTRYIGDWSSDVCSSDLVTAVEIDPLILKLGEKYHFEKPYSSPRVRQVQDDARSYVQNSRDRFRSEERRVGKEGRSRSWTGHLV